MPLPALLSPHLLLMSNPVKHFFDPDGCPDCYLNFNVLLSLVHFQLDPEMSHKSVQEYNHANQQTDTASHQ